MLNIFNIGGILFFCKKFIDNHPVIFYKTDAIDVYAELRFIGGFLIFIWRYHNEQAGRA